MKFIERWSLMKNTFKENIMQHSCEVALIAHCLTLINNKYFKGTVNAERVAGLALYHEVSEVITGDLPTPVKYYNPEIKKAYKDIEHLANKKLISMLPEEFKDDLSQILEPDLKSYEYKLLKGADKICAYIKCIEELKSGNKEFTLAKNNIEEELNSNALPEVRYFLDNFVKGYEKTLDEMQDDKK
jgi:5'-deoxynucleotidase